MLSQYNIVVLYIHTMLNLELALTSMRGTCSHSPLGRDFSPISSVLCSALQDDRNTYIYASFNRDRNKVDERAGAGHFTGRSLNRYGAMD